MIKGKTDRARIERAIVNIRKIPAGETGVELTPVQMEKLRLYFDSWVILYLEYTLGVVKK